MNPSSSTNANRSTSRTKKSVQGQAWWDDLSDRLARCFKEGRYTDGLIAAIDEAGTKLKHHFPAKTTDRTGQQDIVEE
jgi:uncharacterized membrane protein